MASEPDDERACAEITGKVMLQVWDVKRVFTQGLQRACLQAVNRLAKDRSSS